MNAPPDPEIVKVQRSGRFGRGKMAFVYAEHRSRARVMKLSPAVDTAMGTSAKMFFHATWTGDRWRIGQRCEEQDW